MAAADESAAGGSYDDISLERGEISGGGTRGIRIDHDPVPLVPQTSPSANPPRSILLTAPLQARLLLVGPLLVGLLLVGLLLVGVRPASANDKPASTPAADEIAAAEAQRVAEELRRLAARQAWPGVERSFQHLLELGTPTVEDYLHAAHAARDRGDVGESRARLMAAFVVDPETPERQLIDWLFNIDTSYGTVALSSERRKGVALTVEALPFDPNERRAVEYAMAQVTETGGFQGMLPIGVYEYGDEEVRVEPQQTTTITLSAKRGR